MVSFYEYTKVLVTNNSIHSLAGACEVCSTWSK